MGDNGHSPTMCLRRLGHEMRRLREAAGKSIHETFAELEWSTSKISRLENGLTKARTCRTSACCAPPTA